MKLRNIFLSTIILLAGLSLTAQESRFISENTHIKFFSTTPAEDIEANNYGSTSTIDPENGNVVFVVPMQGFEFEKSLMQRHFNQRRFLHTSTYPEARLVGRILNHESIDFETDGTYKAEVEGSLTIKGETNPVRETGTITIKDGTIEVESVLNVTLADYDITFRRGKPSTNIADTVEVTVKAIYN